MVRQFRRAPGRIVASIFALSLAIGAIGVLAIPAISEGTLHDAVGRDGLADIVVDTTTLSPGQLAAIRGIDGVAAAEGESTIAARTGDGFLTRLVGLDLAAQTMDVVQLDAGRLPAAPDEIVASPGIGSVGTTVTADGHPYRVVGVGSTLWWSDTDVLYADLATVTSLSGGVNRLVITARDDSIEQLRSISDSVRTELAAGGDTFTTFPVYLPNGSTPIDQDIEQVSTLIGLLGIVAGLVALVLLASTTNTLITERTREVAVMRALGGRNRPLRRRLRRIAIGITAISLVIGLPLGVFISNLIARMVLEKFVGITPDIAIDWRVLVASAVGALIGARLVAARAARRVTRLPLAEALRDREGAPFGRRWTHRLAARIATGGLFARLATRASLHRPARTLAVVAQVSAAVGAAFLIPSLASSVNEFNAAAQAPWSWESLTIARDPGLPFAPDSIAADPETEAGIWTEGEVEDWQVDVYGLSIDTTMFDPRLVDGGWLEPNVRTAVVSSGFAQRNELRVGDTVELTLAPGPVDYRIVGLADDFGRAIYVERGELAADLGSPGMANVVWSTQADPALDTDVAVRTSTASQLAADDNAGRNAIVGIFGAIGMIVAGVAALAVLSSMTVSLFERRHELAAMQAIGARKRRLRGLLVRELLPIGAIGLGLGLGLGALGTRGIIGSFEASNAVDIGVVDATGSIPYIAAGTFAALVLLAVAVVRSAARRPVAVTLRGAA
jgi:putative ABC transport system permease protein